MTPKKLTIALAISIAANLLLVGYLVGNQSKRFPDFDPTRGYARWAQTLPDERSQPLLKEIRQNFRQHRPPSMRRLQRQFNRTLRAEQLDTDQLRDSLSKIRDAHGQALAGNHEAFLQFVSQLTHNEREQLADSLQRRPGKIRRGPPGAQVPRSR